MKTRRNRRLNPDTFALLKHIFTGILVLAGVALLIVAVWYGTRVESLTITNVEVRGGETIQHSKVETTVKDMLDGTYLGLVPRRFAWFYPESDIRTSIESIDRIHNIYVNRVSGTELSVTFDEYTPQALWCMSDTSEDCFFLDDTGYAFGHAPNLSGGSFIRFIQIGQPATLHDSITSHDSFKAIMMLTELLTQQNWFVSHVELGQDGDAFLQLVGGGEFKVTLTQSPEKTVENLFIVLGSDEFKHITPGNFQYIDLRYGNKVFVNEELAVPEEETASSTIDF